MKKLIALLAVACVGFTSCSETLSAEDKRMEEIQKKFDFSDVDIENIQGLREEDKFSTSDLTVFTGTIDDCAWIGVFDSESGSLKCQYTDVDHPTSYFAYGEEYKYGIGKIVSMYLENNHIVFVIRYADPQYENIGWLDLIVVDGDKQYRYVIDEKSKAAASIMKWTDSSIYIIGGKGFIYDLYNNEILCCVIGTSGRIENDIYHNLIISPTNALHFWKVELINRFGPDLGTRSRVGETHGEDLMISECLCTYDTISWTTEYMWIYEPNPVDASQIPRYSGEYKIRTDDHIVFVATQIEYDGTVTTKTVDIRVENDELIVDIQ